MNRLQSELQRLYMPLPQTGPDTDAHAWHLIDTSDRVRALVMELKGAASWEALAKVWQGVQLELDLPAPAIAVSGVDGLQLWFSLAHPVAVWRAHAFLEFLRQRFLAEVEPGRVRLMPAAHASFQRQDLHAALVPAHQESSGNWSAFLASDLVPVFAETPWLDIPPNEEGQAGLLRTCAVTAQTTFEAAFDRLVRAGHALQCNAPLRATDGSCAESAEAEDVGAADTGLDVASTSPVSGTDARADAQRFLLQVMHDTAVAMALRIEAARSLLQHASLPPPRH